MVALDDIYDAAFDRERFPALIEAVVRSFGAQSGFIGWSDMERGVGFQAEFGNDPNWLRRYVETYAELDVMRPLLQSVPEGVCAPAYPHMQTPEVRESRFYREYLAPQGVVDNLAVNLIKRPGIMAHLALVRLAPSAPFGAAEFERLDALIPHLRRAVYIQSHLVRAADHAAAIHGSAGASRQSMLLSADRTVVEIDPPLAERLRLRTGDTLGDGIIGTMVHRAIERGDAIAAETIDAAGAPLRLLCEVRALEPNRFGDIASGPSPTHAAYFTLLDQPRSIAFDAVGELYRLTPTELRVLRDAIEHGDLAGIGDRLGMARATARTHLHRIYDKTHTRSFAGLSNLAHRFGRLTPD
ncbi:MAG TPA: helix-turn-helix transcriptional regulator [Novosphingobium sp.]|nr:helix-turn-helix transcriptional regulator [Novosphingobium sp.]